MRRIFLLFLAVSLLFSGCGFLGEEIQEPVRFYYLREEYPYNGSEGIIGFEERESSGMQNNLSYLLALYLMGPGEEDLRSPLPAGTRILVESKTEEAIVLRLSDYAAAMPDINYTLACACLAMTCMELTEAEAVTINCVDRSVTIHPDNLLFGDSQSTIPTEDTQ